MILIKKIQLKITPLEYRLLNRYFDYMFYHLEVYHPLNRMYQFQSFYFFFRNCLTACLILFVIVFLLILITLFNHSYTYFLLFFEGMVIFVAVISGFLAKGFRTNMMNRLFYIYYFTHFKHQTPSP